MRNEFLSDIVCGISKVHFYVKFLQCNINTRTCKESFENTLKTCSGDQERCTFNGPVSGSHHVGDLSSLFYNENSLNKLY